METKFDYESASVALEDLKAKGYEKDYNIEFDELYNHVDNYVIDYLYRYEGASDPSDESSVYGLRNTITGDTGSFVVGDLSLVEGRKRNIIVHLEIMSKV